MKKRKCTTKKLSANFIIADRLNALMQKNKLSQAQMAEKTGLSQQTISKYLSGKPPKISNLTLLAGANGVSESYFFGSKESEPTKTVYFSATGEAVVGPIANDPKKPVDNVTESRNIEPVKERLPELLERLKRATQERGKKTDLAKFLSVPLPRISSWLAGEFAPGGEITLQMLQWVEHQERQK
jgi:transcriptional regulator with XRE-family HTH domain